jgi:hypothetical protein
MFRPQSNALPAWIEAEAILPEGLLVFAQSNRPPQTAAARLPRR